MHIVCLIFGSLFALTFGSSANATANAPISPRNTVYYSFDPNIVTGRFFDRFNTSITTALKFWQDNTCLNFVRNDATPDRLQFYHGTRCHATQRQSNIGVQKVELLPSCVGQFVDGYYLSATKFEAVIANALGLHLQTQRADRNIYEAINLTNVFVGKKEEFQLPTGKPFNTYNIPFDYGSVLHPQLLNYAVNDVSPTLEPKDPLFRYTAGAGQEFGAKPTFADVKAMNLLFDCISHCTNPPVCANGGYVNPHTCTSCVCPEGLTGDCSTVQTSVDYCGGTLTARDEWQNITYIAPTNLPHQKTVACYWKIKAADTFRIELEVNRTRFEFPGTMTSYGKGPCGSTFLEVKFGDEVQSTGARFCDYAPHVISSTNDMLLMYKYMDTFVTMSNFSARFRRTKQQASKEQSTALKIGVLYNKDLNQTALFTMQNVLLNCTRADPKQVDVWISSNRTVTVSIWNFSSMSTPARRVVDTVKWCALQRRLSFSSQNQTYETSTTVDLSSVTTTSTTSSTPATTTTRSTTVTKPSTTVTGTTLSTTTMPSVGPRSSQCRSMNDCSPGQKCEVNGKCVSTTDGPSPCRYTYQCSRNYTCPLGGGMCEPITAGVSSHLEEHYPDTLCQTLSDCPKDYHCHEDERTCYRIRDLGSHET